jgi:integrase
MARPPTGQIIERRGKRGKVYAIRFRAYGVRRYETLDVATRTEAEAKLRHTLADVDRGIWKPPAEPVVEVPREEPTFHAFSSEYVASRRQELRPRSVEFLEWALSSHLLRYFAGHRLSAITVEEIDRYRTAKVREAKELADARAQLEARIASASSEEERAALKRELRDAPRPLCAGSINRTIAVLARVLDQAVEYGWIATNPARGRRRRLKAERPRRTWLELDEVRDLLDAAGEHRPLLAVMALAGLRVSEACALRWRDVDLARGRLTVAESKTDAGVRVVELSPDLRDELAVYKASASRVEDDAPVFPTRRGTTRDRGNIRARVLAGAIARANAKREEDGRPPIVGVTNHSLRRTFASLLYEAGASPAYVMAQMGHTNSSLALEVYARKMERQRDTGQRLDALIRGADWAPMGTSGINDAPRVASVENAAGVAAPS